MERIMELALVRAIPDMTIGEMKPSRLKGLFERLQKEVDKDLPAINSIPKEEIELIGKKMDRFGLSTGWAGQERHVGTLLSFCAEMIENSKFHHSPNILKTINLIIEHLENVGDLKTACCWAGSIAAEKWREVLILNPLKGE